MLYIPIWNKTDSRVTSRHMGPMYIETLYLYRSNLFLALFCVLWWGALDRLWLRAAQSVRVCSTTGYITSGLRGPSPQALTLFGGVRFIARRQRRPEKGNADGVRGIFGTSCRVGLRPCDRTHLKNGHIRTLVGRRINNAACKNNDNNKNY